jgi:hypothetical protein
MISQFELQEFTRTSAVFQGVRCSSEQLGLAATESLMELRDDILESGWELDGPLFIRFDRFDERAGEVDFLAGAQLSEPWLDDGPEGLEGADMPGGLAATTWHSGSYASVETAVDALGAWMRAQGLVQRGRPFELHYQPPEEGFDRNWWETQLVWFIDHSVGRGSAYIEDHRCRTGGGSCARGDTDDGDKR